MAQPIISIEGLSKTYAGGFQALKDVNFKGHCTMEIGFNTRKAEPDRYARSALNFCKSLEASMK